MSDDRVIEALKAAARRARIVDVDALAALADTSKITVEADGTVIGAEN
jgi:hypothetical protein